MILLFYTFTRLHWRLKQYSFVVIIGSSPSPSWASLKSSSLLPMMVPPFFFTTSAMKPNTYQSVKPCWVELTSAMKPNTYQSVKPCWVELIGDVKHLHDSKLDFTKLIIDKLMWLLDHPLQLEEYRTVQLHDHLQYSHTGCLKIGYK